MAAAHDNGLHFSVDESLRSGLEEARSINTILLKSLQDSNSLDELINAMHDLKIIIANDPNSATTDFTAADIAYLNCAFSSPTGITHLRRIICAATESEYGGFLAKFPTTELAETFHRSYPHVSPELATVVSNIILVMTPHADTEAIDSTSPP